MNLGQILLVLLGFLFFCFGVCCGQVSVIHFNSEWNTSNNFDISKLKDCKKDSIVICDNPHLKEKHNIVSVPTIIIFDDEQEIKRYQANIMMELTCRIKDIQKEIDKIYLSKFE